MLLAEIDSSFNADRPDDDLSTAFGTETLGFRVLQSSETVTIPLSSVPPSGAERG